MKHSLSPFDALPQSKPVGQQQTDCGHSTAKGNDPKRSFKVASSAPGVRPMWSWRFDLFDPIDLSSFILKYERLWLRAALKTGLLEKHAAVGSDDCVFRWLGTIDFALG